MVRTVIEAKGRPHDPAAETLVVFGHMNPHAQDVLGAAALALNISPARAIESLLMALELDDEGVPTVLHPLEEDQEGSAGPVRRSSHRSHYKGVRKNLMTRAPEPVAEAARQRANELGVSISDYILELLIQDLGPRQTR